MNTRKNYRDIPGQYDRMGQMNPYAAVGAWPGVMPGIMPGGVPGFNGLVAANYATGGEGPLVNPCGSGVCCKVDPPTRSYERVVGLPRVCIDGCDCETIETTVCGPFTLTGLYIAPKVAHYLSIIRLRVGCNDILVNCDPVPAELFSCCEIDENMITAPTVEANSPICLEVENENRNEIEFKGALKGLLCTSC